MRDYLPKTLVAELLGFHIFYDICIVRPHDSFGRNKCLRLERGKMFKKITWIFRDERASPLSHQEDVGDHTRPFIYYSKTLFIRINWDGTPFG
ncbi:hypothetical protein TNCV_4719831 [Trichonephila clavipes]|uniref:Uncharacterized protein n=1 Tax=Trichonephila clavipes TaxID=2585209 RepID=A0A8X6W5W1_TRICX|nr:hypothetical protein TNCV_4719831 [Trichonephila clavipes]